MQLDNVSVLLCPEEVEAPAVRRYAKAAEAAGFHAAWTVDGSADPYVFSHEILAHTTALGSGPCIAARWKRHPMLAAQTSASLDHLYPGRLSVGIGSASWVTDVRASWGAPMDHLVGRMSEYLDIVQRALAGEQVDAEGRYYVALGGSAATPVRRAPIYVAAAGPQMAALGGNKADGVFLHIGTSARIAHLADAAKTAAQRAGRDPAELRVDQVVYACVDETRELALQSLRQLVADGLGNDQLTAAVTELRSAEAAADLIAHREAGNRDAVAEAIPDEFLEQVGVALGRSDSAAQVDEALTRVRAPGVSALTLYPLPGDLADYEGCYDAFFDVFERVGGRR